MHRRTVTMRFILLAVLIRLTIQIEFHLEII